jgi:CheY-like chemotaxis protein
VFSEWAKGAGMPKILIADDSIAVRKVAERLLTEAGLGVTLAANGEEALAYLEKERPDVVVSDVIMPDKSGYEVCAFIRGNPTLAGTPVLLISGIVNDEVTRQADSCRADGVLKKPFQGTSLKDRVLELIAKRQEPAPAVVDGPTADLAAAPAEKTIKMSDQPPLSLSQEAGTLKEVEEQLRKNRVRCEELSKRLSESTEQLARAEESRALLETERKRANDLHEKLVKAEQQVSRIPELESALKAEQDAVNTYRQEAVNWQKASGRIADLESALHAERAAAEQLVQQLSRIPELESALKAEQDAVNTYRQEAVNWQKASGRIADLESALHVERAAAEQLVQQLADLEQVSIRTRDAEAKLATAEQQEAELHRNIQNLEAELSMERRKGEETMGRLHELESVATRVREMEGLLTAEQNRNGILSRQVVEAEQASENATKRLEEMARKLSEIAGLASQLGNGRGEST